MKEVEVEGFKVTIEKSEGGFIVSVPRLPGCTIQVEREEDAVREIRRTIGIYLAGLANSFTPMRHGNAPAQGGGREGGKSAPKMKK